jgi:AraC family transcriptional regulator
MFEAQVKQAAAQTVAYIAMHGAYDQIPGAYESLYGWVAQRGLQPAGEPHAVYLTPPDAGEQMPEWELWAPIADSADVAPDDAGIGVKHVPAHTVAATMYKGPYDSIEPAYRALAQWVTDQGYTLSGPPEEIYYSDPDKVPPEEYLTEIRMPVARTV